MHTHGIQGGGSLSSPLPPPVPRDAEAPAIFSLEPFLEGVDPDGSWGGAGAEEKEKRPREGSPEAEASEGSEAPVMGELLPSPASPPLAVYTRAGVLRAQAASGGQIRASG